jgi:hypothetical protein
MTSGWLLKTRPVIQHPALGLSIALRAAGCPTKEENFKTTEGGIHEIAPYDVRPGWDRSSVCDCIIRTAGEDGLRSQRGF